MSEDVVLRLLQEPVALDVARGPAASGGAPSEPGLYAWWAPAGAITGISGPPHTSAPVALLYVGIAPSRASSWATLRSRLLGNHAGGNTGASTLRRSLAALLTETEGYRVRWTSRTVLLPEDEARLTDWMRNNLALTWAAHPRPWEVETAVIAQLAPPLNQAGNKAHPSYQLVRAARKRWTDSARPA